MISIQTHVSSVSSHRQRAGRATQRGFTMLELSVVLVIAGVLAAATFIGFQTNTRRNSVRENTGLITEAAAELKKKFGLTNTYGAVTTALAVQSRAIPEQLRIPTTNTAQNSYGGLITVAPGTLTQVNDVAVMTWSAVKQGECMDLVIGTADTARRIEVPAGTAVKPTDGVLNLATLATQCESAPNVDVVLSVGRS